MQTSRFESSECLIDKENESRRGSDEKANSVRQAGRLLICVFLSLLALPPLAAQLASQAQNSVATVAGGGGTSSSAPQICTPARIGGIYQGNYYVRSCNQIFKVTPQGQWTLVAGNGLLGYAGDGGPATSAEFSFFNNDYLNSGGNGTEVSLNTSAVSIFVDGSGNVFIADIGNNRIREVFSATGIIQTIAGNGNFGFGGDGGPATSAMLFSPEGVYVDSLGDVFIADTGNNRIREVIGGIISTVVGNGTRGFSGDGGPATNAELNSPYGGWIDSAGNGHIADEGNLRIREVAASTGLIQTVAGNGTPGFSGDGGPATSASIGFPESVFVDAFGNIFIADFYNQRVREVTDGIINTVAGNGTYGYNGNGGPATSAELYAPVNVFGDSSGDIFIGDASGIREVVASTGNIQTAVGNNAFGFSGDGGPATSAQLFLPSGVAVDNSGNIFFADNGNYRIREIVASVGVIKTVAGNGTPGFGGDGGLAISAQLRQVQGVSVDASGNIFFTDEGNLRIREVVAATGIIQTVAGNGNSSVSGNGGPATNAGLGFSPNGLFVDKSGNIFVATGGNISPQVREVVAETGIIQTVAGNGTLGFSGDGGAATSAELGYPSGVVVDSLGNIFIADYGNGRVREVMAASGIIQTVAGNGTRVPSGDGGPAINAGLEPVQLALDGAGNLFIGTSDGSFRAVSAATGIIQTVAGNLVEGFSGDGGPATAAAFNAFPFFPGGYIAVNSAGGLLISDSGNARIRYVAPSPALSLTGLSPSVTAVGIGLTLTVTGTNFVSGAVVNFNGKPEATTFVSATQLTAAIPSSDVATAGTYIVAVSNPLPGGGTVTSNFTVAAAPVSVTISPSSPVTVDAALSFQFSAVVTNAPNTTVTWQVNGVANGNATFGTISTNGLYAAPSAVPTPSSFQVSAVSVADPTKSASVTITIAGASSAPVSVQISPQPATAVVGSTIQFGAVVLNAGTSTAVTWQLLSGSGTGSITASGLYTPPATPPSGNVTIQATSLADPTKNQQISFTVAQVALSFAPGLSGTVAPISAQSGGSSSANLVLNLAPTAGSGTFALTCDQMPPGAACTVSPTSVTTQGGHPGAPFTLKVLLASSGHLGPMPARPRGLWQLLVTFILGSFFAIYWTRRLPLRRARYAYLMIVLICVSLSFLAACSGISQTTVSSPVVSSVRSGTVILARVTATPTTTTGNFTATQMIVPFPVQ